MVELPLSRSGRSAYEVALDAASQAGGILQDSFRRITEFKVKGRSNLVTEVDVASEKAVISLLRDEYPDFTIISEETNSATRESGYTWVIDPLDGTNNFVFGIPFFCVNIALVHNSEVLIGITHDPLHGEYFYARIGEGAVLNGRPIHVGRKTKIAGAIPGFDIGYDDRQAAELLRVAERLRPEVHTMRVLGSSSLGLAYVAAGRLDLYFHRFLYPWDIAPGIRLVREAGGVVTDWEGREAVMNMPQLVAANSALHRAFLDWSRKAK